MPDRSRSLSVSAGIGSTTSGTLTPLWSDSGPPTTTSVSSASPRLRATRSRSLPSSSSSEQPIEAASMISGCGRFTREALPGVGLRSSRNGWPVCRNTRPPEKLPTRSFGPCTSARMPIGRSKRSSSWRIMAKRAAWSSCVPWLKFSRNTSAPAWNRRVTTSSEELAGPSVAMILVRRRRRSFGRVAIVVSFRRSGWRGRR